jgi:hypothetical protein
MIMKFSVLPALLLVGFAVTPQTVLAVGLVDAEIMFQKFNDAFLITSGSDVYYKKALNDADPAWGSFSTSLNILAAEDAYERTGSPATKTLINNLLTTWLKYTQPPWNWNSWNDDLGWYTMALIRGYHITGNAEFLTQARYGFDLAWDRGWDTTYNNGGIWEQVLKNADDDGHPHKKEALSNDSLGKVACLIYQANHDQWYLDRCRQIYDWVWNHLFNRATGQINNGVFPNGDVDVSWAVYSQGTFLDYANLVWEVSGDRNVFNDATNAINGARNIMTVNGIFTTSNRDYNTWADEMARGVGNFVRDNNLWDTYYSWMYINADAILNHRRTDLGLTWNAWDQTTPNDNALTSNNMVSAVAWLQYVPAVPPNRNIGGIRVITNKLTGMAIDSTFDFGNGNSVIQWGLNSGQNQRWKITPNTDNTFNIVSLSTWQAIDCPIGNTANNVVMIQYKPSRDNNQRWSIDSLGDGSYKITNIASGQVLDGSSTRTNGDPLIQWGWNGGDQQRWILT